MTGFPAFDGEGGNEKKKDGAPATTAPVDTANAVPVEVESVVCRHELKPRKGPTLAYTTTTGMMPIRNEKGEVEARIFYMAYTLDDPPADRPRPLMFSFNGGPGSSSVWLHLGGLAPKRVEMLPDGAMPKPPFSLVDNEHTWLAETDLVFIDPVDTGYSRAESEDLAKQYREIDKDIAAVGEFIRLYLTRYRRWGAPLFLVGESYGTFRAAGLAGYLIERGLAFNGIVLVSSILNLQTARFTLGNDLPHILYVPTFAATAWFHGKVPKDLRKKKQRAFLDEVEAWVETEYAPALALGDRLPDDRRQSVANALARYTGLSERYVEQADLRINIHAFCKELLRDERRTVGRLDSRFQGVDRSGVAEYPEFDPSMAAIRPPFTAMLNDYVRGELGHESDVEYHILRGVEWNWGDAAKGYPDTSDALRSAFAKNPYLQLFIASGYYDLATPYYGTVYTLNHMALDRSLRGNIHTEEYPVGHMVYIERDALAKLHTDVAAFVAHAITG
ncbi:MAG: peptidase S10 [Chloroflexia bacterium]|nr:peptidase S10 [Chloroflexia bacterium]